MLPPATAPPMAGSTTTTSSSTPPPSAAPPSVAAPGGPLAIHFIPAQMDANASGVFTVALAVDNAKDMASAQFQLQFDPKVVHLNDVVSGRLLAVDGQQPVPVKNIMNDSGSATVEITRTAGTPGVTASGILATLHFQAVGKGAVSVAAPNLTVRDSQGKIIGQSSPQVTVNVK